MRPYFCPYRAKGFIPWYPGRCPGLGTGCPFRALAARFINRLQEVGASPYPKYEPPSGALAPLYQSCFFLILNTLPQGFIKSRPYQCKYLPARSAKTKKNEAPKRKSKTKPRNKKSETNKALQRTKKAPRLVGRGAFFIERLHCFPVSVARRQECGD